MGRTWLWWDNVQYCDNFDGATLSIMIAWDCATEALR